jgi:hypothetical protein
MIEDLQTGKQNALGFTPENSANKSTDVNADQASATKYAAVKAIYDWAAPFYLYFISDLGQYFISGLGQNQTACMWVFSPLLGSDKLIRSGLLWTTSRKKLTKVAVQGKIRLIIRLSLGHDSIQKTGKYLGVEQDLTDAPRDHLGLSISA